MWTEVRKKSVVDGNWINLKLAADKNPSVAEMSAGLGSVRKFQQVNQFKENSVGWAPSCLKGEFLLFYVSK